MFKIIFSLISCFCFVSFAFASDNISNGSLVSKDGMEIEPISEIDTNFNKSRITFDDFGNRKLYVGIRAHYFQGFNNLSKLNNWAVGINIGYQFIDYVGGEISLLYGEGGSGSISGVNISSVAKYDLAALVTFRYPAKLSVGILIPYAGIGGGYTFGSYKEGSNRTGPAINAGFLKAEVGLKYTISMITFAFYAYYHYGFTEVLNQPFHGMSYGGEINVKF